MRTATPPLPRSTTAASPSQRAPAAPAAVGGRAAAGAPPLARERAIPPVVELPLRSAGGAAQVASLLARPVPGGSGVAARSTTPLSWNSGLSTVGASRSEPGRRD